LAKRQYTNKRRPCGLTKMKHRGYDFLPSSCW